MNFTDEQMEAMAQIIAGMPVAMSIVDIMNNEVIHNEIENPKASSIKDFQCQICIQSPIFLQLAKIVDKNVNSINQTGGYQHNNTEILPRLLGQLILLGIIDLFVNSEAHKKTLTKQMLEITKKIFVEET